MNLTDRRKNYEAIEQYRKRPLIVYATSTRQNLVAMMAGDAVREFIDHVDAIKDGDAVDVLLHSYGGDALAAWKIMSILRARFKTIGVLVPLTAFSAATVFALGADEIIMHPHASLGPIDPQIQMRLPDGSVRQVAYEDLGAFLRFIFHDVKLSEQEHVSRVVEKLFASIDPLVVGGAKRASDLSAEVGERLLRTHLADAGKAKQIAVALTKSFLAHGDAVSRDRARSLELGIGPDDKKLEQLIWTAYLGLESYMDLRKPFLPLADYLADPKGAASLAPAAPLHLPGDTPQQIAVQAWQGAINGALQAAQAGKGVQVPYSIVRAVLESAHVASEERGDGLMTATRQPTGEVKLVLTEGKSGWRSVTV